MIQDIRGYPAVDQIIIQMGIGPRRLVAFYLLVTGIPDHRYVGQLADLAFQLDHQVLIRLSMNFPAFVTDTAYNNLVIRIMRPDMKLPFIGSRSDLKRPSAFYHDRDPRQRLFILIDNKPMNRPPLLLLKIDDNSRFL